jgi:hypothetical protein
MKQKSNDMETLANDLVENTPFEADKEISYVVNDAIHKVTESITNIKEQSIAEWTSSRIPAKSLSPQIKQAVDYAMTQRQHEVPEHGAHNLHSNPGMYRTPVQSKHHETNNTPLEEEERKLPWNHMARTMRTSIQVMSNIHRFKREVIHHNLTADPRQDQLENFYNTLITSLKSYEMPIRRLTHLEPRGTTLPSKPTIDASTLDTVTRVLFGKLLEAIPEECTSL